MSAPMRSFKAMAGILSLLDYILAAAAHTTVEIAILQLPEATQRRRPVLQTSTAAWRADGPALSRVFFCQCRTTKEGIMRASGMISSTILTLIVIPAV